MTNSTTATGGGDGPGAGPGAGRPSRLAAIRAELLPQGLDRTDLIVLAALAIVAFVVRLVPLLRGGGLHAVIDYDDGVYFGSTIAWLNGRIPYRDFLLLHPPGMLYLLSPFAALTAVANDGTAFMVARLGIMVLGAFNTVLVALIARRLGRLAAICAGALYAVWPVPAGIERTTWLIAPQNTLLLLALLVLASRRAGDDPAIGRAAVAGIFVGLAMGFQLWGIVPFTVILAWIALTWQRRGFAWLRAVVAYGVAAAVALAAIGLPFLLAAGPQMLRYIVTDQLGRVAPSAHDRLSRLYVVAGLPANLIPPLAILAVGIAVAVVVLLVAVRVPGVRLWVALLFAQAGFLLFIPVFFGHYAGWVAPAVCLSVGGSAAAIIELVRGVRPGPVAGRGGGVTATRVVAGAYGLGVVALFVLSMVRPTGTRFNAALASAQIAGARCVTADSPTLLIQTNTLRRNVLRGCPLRLDPTGTSYDTGRDLPPGARPRRDDPEYQRLMVEYYGGSDAALFMRLTSGDAFEPPTWAAIRRELPITHKHGVVTILTRR